MASIVITDTCQKKKKKSEKVEDIMIPFSNRKDNNRSIMYVSVLQDFNVLFCCILTEVYVSEHTLLIRFLPNR